MPAPAPPRRSLAVVLFKQLAAALAVLDDLLPGHVAARMLEKASGRSYTSGLQYSECLQLLSVTIEQLVRRWLGRLPAFAAHIACIRCTGIMSPLLCLLLAQGAAFGERGADPSPAMHAMPPQRMQRMLGLRAPLARRRDSYPGTSGARRRASASGGTSLGSRRSSLGSEVRRGAGALRRWGAGGGAGAPGPAPSRAPGQQHARRLPLHPPALPAAVLLPAAAAEPPPPLPPPPAPAGQRRQRLRGAGRGGAAAAGPAGLGAPAAVAARAWGGALAGRPLPRPRWAAPASCPWLPGLQRRWGEAELSAGVCRAAC
jgi:hypothetical protein